MSQTIEIRTALSPRPCRARIVATTDHTFNLFGKRPVRRFLIGPFVLLHRALPYNHSFQKWAVLGLSDTGSGSRLKGWFGMNPVIQAALVLWAAVMFGGVGLHLVETWRRHGLTALDLGLVAFAAAVLIGGIAMIRWSMGIHDDDRAMLVDFLETTLDGRS